MEQVGERSYKIEIKQGQRQDVYIEQLRLCVWDLELLKEDPLFYEEGQAIPIFQEDPPVRQVLGHRVNEDGTLEFHVMRGSDVAPKWEPVQKFLMACDDGWLKYVREEGVEVSVSECLNDIQGWATLMAEDMGME